ncbi:hypothetical protein VD0002_g412 [Verticillium dahliae]|nr:hypothetical protein BJF96_g7068 [Verticillium dahliae]PNH37630.1 hypothetical protein VD0004_g9167 [Verticillium dahliae]PNH56881.1 hypothetical protein VD0003_g844 [Verticillium dahliae]PNH63279.1 hypothetical protein VD0001_g9193 [Verticillium dahliae]PNH70136.1 hypothetical protein VD0002_g412 [Verticillium dahliae]
MRIPLPNSIAACRPTRRMVRAIITWILLTGVSVFILISGYLFHDDIHSKSTRYLNGGAADYFKVPYNYSAAADYHVIDWLIHEARANHERLLHKRALTLAVAAKRYRERRGRHPPPGFDRWFQHALQDDSIIIEDFYDRVYHDLTPFWAVDANRLAEQASYRYDVIRIRGGVMVAVETEDNDPVATPLWAELIGEVAAYLPDMDIPLNEMNEPRVLVPFEKMAEYVAKERATRALVSKDLVDSDYVGLAAVDSARDESPILAVKWLGEADARYWDLVRAACEPGTPSRDVPALTNLTSSSPPPTLPYEWIAPFTQQGYIENFTRAADLCLQPHLRALHSDFVEPFDVKTTRDLIPIFTGGKLGVNNDILLPSTAYLEGENTNRIAHLLGPLWKDKKDQLVFRGIASGGRTDDSPWRHFHRHRLVEMLNGTAVHRMELDAAAHANTFDFPPPAYYGTERRRLQKVGAWLSKFASAGFTMFACGDEATLQEAPCPALAPHVRSTPAPRKGKAADFVAKYIPLVDRERGEGGVAGRFRHTLLSTSVPLKATVYAEWHDDRLVPWLHFVPLDNTFRDLYNVLDYFTDGDAERDDRDAGVWGRVGIGRIKRGDKAARWIAESGRAWASRVLRREDMRLYVWRLLLEWARVCDENRERLGFVGDLV